MVFTHHRFIVVIFILALHHGQHHMLELSTPRQFPFFAADAVWSQHASFFTCAKAFGIINRSRSSQVRFRQLSSGICGSSKRSDDHSVHQVRSKDGAAALARGGRRKVEERCRMNGKSETKRKKTLRPQRPNPFAYIIGLGSLAQSWKQAYIIKTRLALF